MSFLRVPTCRTCLQRLSGISSQQIRTKTKAAKKGITVQLLEDIPKVGRKGTPPTATTQFSQLVGLKSPRRLDRLHRPRENEELLLPVRVRRVHDSGRAKGRSCVGTDAAVGCHVYSC